MTVEMKNHYRAVIKRLVEQRESGKILVCEYEDNINATFYKLQGLGLSRSESAELIITIENKEMN